MSGKSIPNKTEGGQIKSGCWIAIVLISLVCFACTGDAQVTNALPKAPLPLQTGENFKNLSFAEVKQAANQGNTAAMVWIGRSYRFGQGLPRDAKQAVEWFRKAADKDDPLGMVNLGWMYGYVAETPRDESAARELYMKAAVLGQNDAMFELYLSYLNGKGLAPDRGEALKWLGKSAEAGNAGAQVLFGFFLEEPMADREDREDRVASWKPSNAAEAVRWYRRSAEQNHAGGQYHLALCFMRGKGVEQDEERGLELMRKAADQNQLYAMVRLADLYARGIGEPRSEKDRPANLLQRAAETEFGEAFDPLIQRYEHGLGLKRDLVLAAKWYCHAAAARPWGYPLPKEGKNLRNQKAREGNPLGEVLVVYLKAMTPVDFKAAMQLGEMYADGREVPKDPANAWLWFNLAAERGSSEAQKSRTAIEKEIAAEEMTGLKQRANSFGQELRRLFARLPSNELRNN